MRGDSVRDFYAKAVALLGLGVLAGAGALVDYWPTQSALPVPQPAFAEPALAAALPVPSSAVVSAGMRVHVDRVFLRRVQLTNPLAVVAAPGSRFMANALSEPPAVIAAPARPMSVEPELLLASLGSQAVLMPPQSAFDTVSAGADDAPVEIVAVSSVRTSQEGFLAGALKKTGDGIVSAAGAAAGVGAKTGASIVGAFRAVGSAVHKALPL